MQIEVVEVCEGRGEEGGEVRFLDLGERASLECVRHIKPPESPTKDNSG